MPTRRRPITKTVEDGEQQQRIFRRLAERMRPVMAQLAGLSAHKAAAELNRRKIASATGGKWYAATVIKLRDRLAVRTGRT